MQRTWLQPMSHQSSCTRSVLKVGTLALIGGLLRLVQLEGTEQAVM